MKKQSSFTQFFVIIIVGLVGLFFISKYIFSNGGLPSLENFMSSSTSVTSSKNVEPSVDIASTDSSVQVSQAIPDSAYTIVPIKVPKGTIQAMVADSPERMEIGLSFRNSLAPDKGMLFPFETAGIYQFWMKDMRFPLDIIWVSAKNRVIGIDANIKPETYPNTYISPDSVLYVLEVPGGAAKKWGITVGTVLDL